MDENQLQDKPLQKIKLKKVDVIIFILLLVTLIALSFAWLYEKQGQSQIAGVSNFNVAGDVYFENPAGSVPIEKYMSGGLLKVDTNDADAENYLGKLRVNANYTGYSPAYIRVQVLEQWVDEQTDTLQAVQYVPYQIAGTDLTKSEGLWVDNRKQDLYYYFSKPISSADTKQDFTIDKPLSFPCITGVKQDFLDSIKGSSATLYLIIAVEAVQPNRFEQFWDIKEIPQP